MALKPGSSPLASLANQSDTVPVSQLVEDTEHLLRGTGLGHYWFELDSKQPPRGKSCDFCRA